MGGEIVLPETSVTVHASLYGGCGTLALNDVEPPDPQGPIWSLALPMDELSGFFGGGTTDSEATAGRPVVCSGCGFFSKPWLGELVPDADFGCYQSNGNLATADGFARAARSALAFPDLPRGSNWAYPSGSALDDLGGSSLLQTGGTAGCFVQGVNSGPAAALTDELSAITRAVGLAAPAVGATQFAFSLNGTPSMPLEQRAYQDLFPDQDATLFEAFTTTEAAGNMGAGAIRIGAPGTCKAAYFVPIGDVARSGEEHRAAAFKSLAFGLRTLFVASEPDRQDGVTPPPIVSIALPTPKQVVQRPDAIEIRWGTDFKRFDEQRYTTRFAADWRGAEASLVYVVTYRQVDDPQWHHAFDGVPIEPGVRPVDPTRWLQDTGDGKESYLVATPTSRFPAGDYVLRVDCFRREGALHGAHHEVFVEVKR